MKDKDTLYARWLSNEITEEELDLLEKDGAISDLERITRTTDRWNVPKYDKVEGLKTFKTQKDSKPAKSKVVHIQWAAGIAASFLILFTLFNYYKNDGQEVIIANHGMTESLQMADGSTVIANDGSSITYNKDNWTNDRSIALVGEAFFAVEKGTPFVVNTKNGSITVLGTEFNVRAWGDNLYVECYEGSVRVSVGTELSILTQSESVNVIAGELKNKKDINHTSPPWSGGTSRFYDENINAVFEELERQYQINVSVTSLNQSFSGSFSHSNLEDALRSICIPLGLSYRISNDQTEVFIQ